MRSTIQTTFICFALFLLALVSACTKTETSNKKTELWIYTSLYKDVIAQMRVPLEKEFPNVKFNFYQSGSENVAARMNAEFSAGTTKADLVMTSDPFWYLELKQSGKFLKYESPKTQSLTSRFKDPDGMFTIVRVPVVVMAYNTEAVSEKDAPKSFDDLLDPKWNNKLSMGSPLQSGTAFSAVGQLVRKKGWGYFEQLRKLNIISAGGNSAVISRMETKERPVGIVLLENVLDAQKRGVPLKPIYPTDGSIMAPSPIAILSSTKHPELAKRVYDFFFSDTMQTENIKGRMYSVFPHISAPQGARPFEDVIAKSMEWNEKVLTEVHAKRKATKKKFMSVVLN